MTAIIDDAKVLSFSMFVLRSICPARHWLLCPSPVDLERRDDFWSVALCILLENILPIRFRAGRSLT